MDSLFNFLPCCNSSDNIVEDALYPITEKNSLADQSFEEQFSPRNRKRFTSSPKNMTKLQVVTPCLTPISLSKYLMSTNNNPLPSFSDRDLSLPEMTDYSR